MAYQEKYNYTFVSIDGKTNLVEIWQDTAETLTAEEVKCGSIPFTVELPELDHKFQPVWGRGCELNIISEADMKFFEGLYHVDKKEFLVKHYIDSSINFIGYLNSEMSRESYSETTNYPVQIIGNDGFSLLERIQFLQDDGNIYTGVKSLFEILTICIDRIGLPFSAINICLSTTSNHYTAAANETLLHNEFVNCTNFINEDGEAETMRKVLESILQPYGAVIVQQAGAIWVTDIHTKAGAAGMTFKSYVLDTTWDYDTDVSFTQIKNISLIGYNGTGSEIERSGGKNKQVVSYSPYPIKELYGKTLNDISEVSGTIPSSYSTYQYYKYKTLTGHNALTTYSPASLEFSYRYLGLSTPPETVSDACVAVRWHAGTAATKIIEMTAHPNIYIKQWLTDEPGIIRPAFRSVAIKINMQAQFNRYYTYGGKLRDDGVRTAILYGKLKIGDKYASAMDSWGSDAYFPIIVTGVGNENITCKWFDVKGWERNILLFRNAEELAGEVLLEIYSQFDYIDTNGTQWTNTNVHNASVRIRNLSVELIDSETQETIDDADVEYIGYLDTLQKDEAEKIDLLCGSDVCFTDRGKIMYNNAGLYTAAAEWIRASQTNRIETLLLNSLSSNYRAGYITLISLKLHNTFNVLNVFNDTLLDGTHIFMPKSMRINYRDDVAELTAIEILEDQLTIVPL